MVTYEVFIRALFSLLLVGAGSFFLLMSEIGGLRREMQGMRDELRQEIRENARRMLEALYFHRHDAEGAAVFYVAALPAVQAE